MSDHNAPPGNGDLYRHYKGGLYRFVAYGTDEATGREVVIYRGQADGRWWVRARAVWEDHRRGR